MKYIKSLLIVLSFLVTLTHCGDVWDLINSNSGNLSNNANATLVIGQSNFQTVSSATQAGGLNFPNGVYFDNTRLLIADSGSHRVLVYNSFPLNSGTNANVVVGQTGFTTNGSNANGT